MLFPRAYYLAPLRLFLAVLAFFVTVPAARAAPTRLEDHPHLAATVTTEFLAAPLPVVLKELGEKNGVTLTIREPVLQRRRMYLMAKQQPAGLLLAKIAGVVGAAWVAQGEGYELRRTRKTIEEASSYRFVRGLRLRLVREVFYKRHRRAIQIGLAETRVPPPAREDGDRAPYVTAENATLAPVLSALTERQIRQIFDAERWELGVYPPWPPEEEPRGGAVGPPSERVALSIRAAELPERGREAIVAYCRSRMGDPMASAYQALAADPNLTLHFGPFSGGNLLVTLLGAGGGDGGDLRLIQGADAGWEDPKFDLNEGLVPGDRALLAWWFPRWRHAGSYPYDPGKVTGLGEAEAQRRLEMDEDRSPLNGKRGGKLWLGEALQVLRNNRSYTIIGDYFTRPFLWKRPAEAPQLGGFLNELAETFGRDFQVDGDLITFRSTTWPDDEVAEPEGDFVDACVRERTAQGALSADTWLEMGRLPREQLATLCLISELHGKALMEEAVAALSGKGAIDFFHALRPNQRAKATGGAEDREKFLAWSDLDPVQKRKALAMAWAMQGARVTPQQVAEQFRLTLRFTSPSALKEGTEGKRVPLVSLSMGPSGGAYYRLRAMPQVKGAGAAATGGNP